MGGSGVLLMFNSTIDTPGYFLRHHEIYHLYVADKTTDVNIHVIKRECQSTCANFPLFIKTRVVDQLPIVSRAPIHAFYLVDDKCELSSDLLGS
jgi:ethanolamine utilization protein EutP (predicted NTPase)